MQLKIKYHSDIEPIKAAHKGEWIDLRVAKNTFIPEGEYALVSLGVSIALPENHEALVIPRSSTFKNFGLIQTNGVGLIDNSYCGDNDIWRFPCFCLQAKDIINGTKGTLLKKNDRICQFRILKNQDDIEWEEVDFLGNEDRGGIGSTGV